MREILDRLAHDAVTKLGSQMFALALAGAFAGGCADDDDATADGAETTETTGGGAFAFSESPVESYSQLDRLGMPAVGTAVISSKDAYNADSPVSDAAGDYVAEITAAVTGLHEALDDDLTGADLTPCAVDACIAQAAPLVVPDVLRLDTSVDSGFPNGRRLEDPVIDVTLAVILLDLAIEGQDPTSLVGLNPTANDLPFETDFPYLASRHAP